MFETLQPHTEVREHNTYQAGDDLLVTFKKTASDPIKPPHFEGDYGFDLYDFDDLIFQTAGSYSSLEDAKQAAIAAVTSIKVDHVP